MDMIKEVGALATEFEQCRDILVALGDANRQHMILEMMKSKKCDGMRVNEITEMTHLSRPAVSHHLQILKRAGILKVRREATKNYYYFDPDMKTLALLTATLQRTIAITEVMTQKYGEEDHLNTTTAADSTLQISKSF